MQRYLTIFSICILLSCAAFGQSVTDPITIVPKKLFSPEGYKKCGITMRADQLLLLFKEDPQMQSFVKPMTVNYSIEALLKATGSFLILWPVSEDLFSEGDANWNLAIAGAGCLLAAIPFDRAFKKKAREGINYYNNGYKTATRISIRPSLSAEGMGVVVRF